MKFSLKHYLRRNLKFNSLVALLLALAQIAITLCSVALTKFTDSIRANSSAEFIKWILIMVAMYLVLVIPLSQLSEFTQAVATQRMNRQVRQDLAQGLTNLDYDHFHHEGTVGKFTSWLNNDIQQIQENGFTNFFVLIQNLCCLVMPLIALAFYHWSLVVISLILALILAFVPQRINRALIKSSTHLTKTNETFVNTVENVLGGFDTLLAFHQKHQIFKLIDRGADQVQQANISFQKKKVEVTTIITLLSILSQIAIVGFTGFLVLRGNLTIGAMLTTGNLAGSIFNGMAGLDSSWSVLSAVDPVFEKYQNLQSDPKPEQMITTGTAATLTLDAVTSGTDGHQWLAPVSATVLPGDKVLLTGPSGAGKSTLLKLIAGFNQPSAGTINWQPLDQNNVLYIPQSPYIFNASIRYNLSLGRDYPDSQIQQVLTAVGLDQRVAHLPQGWDTEISAVGADFSGGERQRLALARAFLIKAPIILFDESTSNVDPQAAVPIEQAVLSRPGQTVIFVSHNLHPDIATSFDQTIHLTSPGEVLPAAAP
ncbi:ABC transporter transmembrane domain-containing protein [Lapidilactobacillus luobeiensis]|uniref:ABC transporter transmembrane domain-containing protein n=1 Tax=Lapidilactobacillus luobeiensis TaxID=2950371 RepID=UPI0021C3464E|nr:ABC transporter ATP-binding protein [Lapidilactobacillus luobeiensis]